MTDIKNRHLELLMNKAIEAVESDDADRLGAVVAVILTDIKTLFTYFTFFVEWPLATLEYTDDDRAPVADYMVERLSALDIAERDIRNYVDELLRNVKPRKSLTRRRFAKQVHAQIAVMAALFLESEQRVTATRQEQIADVTAQARDMMRTHGY